MPAKSIAGGEAQFDQRLFNTSKGMDSGYGDDEAYNVYDKPWREGSNLGQHLYRPSKNVDKEVYGDDLDTLIKTNRLVLNIGYRFVLKNIFHVCTSLHNQSCIFLCLLSKIFLCVADLCLIRSLVVQTEMPLEVVQFNLRRKRRIHLGWSGFLQKLRKQASAPRKIVERMIEKTIGKMIRIRGEGRINIQKLCVN